MIPHIVGGLSTSGLRYDNYRTRTKAKIGV